MAFYTLSGMGYLPSQGLKQRSDRISLVGMVPIAGSEPVAEEQQELWNGTVLASALGTE
jgi:hypothetical protein